MSSTVRRACLLAGLAVAALGTSGCIGETFQRGYVVPADSLELISRGSSREQVLLTLGTPSTTADFGSEIFYYISQTTSKPIAFMNERVTDQRVIAVYFDKNGTVEKVADYRLKDGRVFDFVSRTTPTGGRDFSFIRQLLSSSARPSIR